MITLDCLECGISFEAQRTSAKFCSPNCRVKFNNKIPVEVPDILIIEPATKMVVTKEKLKVVPSDEKMNAVRETMDKINKDFGVGTVMLFGDKPQDGYHVVSTGSLKLNRALGIGGLPLGRIVEIYGWESCISEYTYIKFLVIHPETGTVQDCKGETIKRLYERFNGIKKSREGKTDNSDFYVISINEKDRIIRNKIADVVKTGVKECFKVKTKSGFELQATAEHKFYIGYKYVPLSELSVGDDVFIHNNTTFKGRTARSWYNEILVKYYYKGTQKIVEEKYKYYRIRKSRLVYEAYLNSITLDEYLDLLNSGIDKMPNDWVTIPEGFHVHHVDENKKNDTIDNLELIDPSTHGRLHSNLRKNNLRFIAVKDEIVSIETVGEIETYDIKCFYPYNNFIAAGFVVHNSGKTTIALNAIADAQKQGLKCLLVDAENAFDPEYADALGVDVDKLQYCQPSYGEQGFEVVDRMISSNEAKVVVIDSVAAMIPKAELEGEMGDNKMGLHARLMSQACRKLVGTVARQNVLLIFINQFRHKIGGYGNPEVTTGGNALQFYASVRMEVKRSTSVENSVNNSNGDKAGNQTTVKVIKNKCAAPFRKAEFNIMYGTGIDNFEEVVDIAVEQGIIKKSGSWYSYQENKLGQGVDAVYTLLKDNEEMFNEIKSKLNP